MSDSDEDSVPDDIEISGIPMPSGEIVYPDPNNKHSDDDGLTDGEEVGTLVRNPASPACTPDEAVEYKFYFNIKSDPTKVDSDGDGLNDDEEKSKGTNPLNKDSDGDMSDDFHDSYPLEPNTLVYNRQEAYEYSHTWFNNYNTANYYYGEATNNDCANFASQCVYAGGMPQCNDWFMQKCNYSFVTGKSIALLRGCHYGIADNGQSWMWSTSWTANDLYAGSLPHPDYFRAYRSKYFKEFSTIEDFNELIKSKQVQKGDLIYFYDNTDCRHVCFIQDVTDNDIIMASHTSEYENKSFRENFSDFSNTYRYFCIVCIDDIIIE